MGRVTHKHHIVPRHSGGSDAQDNIVELSVDEHSEAHRLLYEKNGDLRDFFAWKMLSGKTEEAEIVRIELSKQGFARFLASDRKSEWRQKISRSLVGRTPSQESLKKRSESMRKAYAEGRMSCWFSTADKEFFRKNYDSMRLAEGRRTSPRWRESVTADEYRMRRCTESAKSRKVTINGTEYPSIRNAAKSLGIPYSRLRSLLDGKNFLTL
jgi:hypothetical protein